MNPLIILITFLTSSVKTKEEIEKSKEFENFLSNGEKISEEVRFIMKEQRFDDLLLDLVNFINLVLSNKKDIIVFISTCYMGISTFRRIQRDFTFMKISLKFSGVFKLSEELTEGKVSTRLFLGILRYFSILTFLIYLFFVFNQKKSEGFCSGNIGIQEKRECMILKDFEKIIEKELNFDNTNEKFKIFLENEGKIDIDEMKYFLKRRFQEVEIEKEKLRIEENLKKENKEKKRIEETKLEEEQKKNKNKDAKNSNPKKKKKPTHRTAHNMVNIKETEMTPDYVKWGLTLEVKAIDTHHENGKINLILI